MTNLPSFAIHNTDTADFTIPKTTNLDLIGVYLVTIRSTICVPDDYTQSACTIWTVQYTFEVTIIADPCIAATFTIDPAIFPNPFEYIVTQTANV